MSFLKSQIYVNKNDTFCEFGIKVTETHNFALPTGGTEITEMLKGDMWMYWLLTILNSFIHRHTQAQLVKKCYFLLELLKLLILEVDLFISTYKQTSNAKITEITGN